MIKAGYNPFFYRIDNSFFDNSFYIVWQIESGAYAFSKPSEASTKEYFFDIGLIEKNDNPLARFFCRASYPFVHLKQTLEFVNDEYANNSDIYFKGDLYDLSIFNISTKIGLDTDTEITAIKRDWFDTDIAIQNLISIFANTVFSEDSYFRADFTKREVENWLAKAPLLISDWNDSEFKLFVILYNASYCIASYSDWKELVVFSFDKFKYLDTVNKEYNLKYLLLNNIRNF